MQRGRRVVKAGRREGGEEGRRTRTRRESEREREREERARETWRVRRDRGKGQHLCDECWQVPDGSHPAGGTVTSSVGDPHQPPGYPLVEWSLGSYHPLILLQVIVYPITL